MNISKILFSLFLAVLGTRTTLLGEEKTLRGYRGKIRTISGGEYVIEIIKCDDVPPPRSKVRMLFIGRG